MTELVETGEILVEEEVILLEEVEAGRHLRANVPDKGDPGGGRAHAVQAAAAVVQTALMDAIEERQRTVLLVKHQKKLIRSQQAKLVAEVAVAVAAIAQALRIQNKVLSYRFNVYLA